MGFNARRQQENYQLINRLHEFSETAKEYSAYNIFRGSVITDPVGACFSTPIRYRIARAGVCVCVCVCVYARACQRVGGGGGRGAAGVRSVCVQPKL